ncbi:SUMO-specific isopeptidase USPL1 isoform B [Alligator mississippiensis]|uniref:SUMO-specific isopeptidase USPL1 isoform B n=1 Tax=Alligator mississippiensis TaxID=8496 RepID=A0A151MPB3_ALLMI|nr:SUMO-specific isopeptidase USPL1 isoform B [Alligator mississippiensis]
MASDAMDSYLKSQSLSCESHEGGGQNWARSGEQDYNFGSTTSDKYCPACKEKGQIRGLRTYRINFQESIFLCENPQCIYPLGYKPLDSVIMTCDSANHQTPALVHLEVLKIVMTRACTEDESVLQRLLTKYSKATALLKNCQSSELKNVLPKAEMHLNEIRNTIFVQLQPQLKCELGKEESPVFALPLLLEKDPEVKKLFLHTFSWKFECLLCGYKQQDSCRKMLTTFTNIIPEWHPLNAVHIGPCNKCQDKSQRREMILEKIPSVFMLHFVEGLPHNKLKNYSFQFEGDFYEITIVVQYQNNQKHFVTWVLNPDETWLECDDLKGPYCNRCERFEVPPSEIHIVIWERKTSQVPNKRQPHKLSPQFQKVQVDSEGNPLENEQMVKNNLVVETGTKQQLESSCLPKAPCTGDVTGGMITVEMRIIHLLRQLKNQMLTKPVDFV